MINTPYKHLERTPGDIRPGVQFLIFVGVVIGVILVGNIIGLAIVTGMYGMKTLTAITALNASAPHLVSALWIIQITGTTLPILVSSVLFANNVVKGPQDYLKTNFQFHWGLLLLVLLVMFMSMPMMELLSNINQKMKLPHFLKGVEDWMKDSENSAQKVTEVFLRMDTVWDMLLDVLAIGLLTAIVEEFMFRGVMQTIFVRWTKSIHAAVWITAVLFSAFHMEFYGFLPRLFLGVLFGYFVAWSGSIWPAVWAHFLNNATDVVITYLFQQKIIKQDPDDQHMFNFIGYIISTLILLTLLFIYQKIAVKKTIIPV